MRKQSMKYAFACTLGLGVLTLVPSLAAEGAEVAQQAATQAPAASGGLIATIGSFLNFMRGETVAFYMQILNFLILMFLLFKFVVPPVEKALEEGVSDIETRLNAQEQQKKQLLEKIEELKAALAGIEEEKAKRLSEAKDQAAKIKEEILTEAREAEMRIFDNVDQSAAAYYYEKINQIKDDFFEKVSKRAGEDLQSSKNEAKMSGYGLSLIESSEVNG